MDALGSPCFLRSSNGLDSPVYSNSRGSVQNSRLTFKQEELLTEDQELAKERFLYYLKSNDKRFLQLYEKKIVELNQIGQKIDVEETKFDLRKLLELVKIFDLAVSEHNRKSELKQPVRTYKIRTKILKKNPLFTTHEIYTKTLDPKKIKDRDYLQDPKNWIPERIGAQAKIIVNQYIKTKALAERLKNLPYHLYIIKAPTGGGKSHFIKTQFQDNQNISGILNPDEFKFSLKKLAPYLVNLQVHQEGVVLCKNLKLEIIKKISNVIMEGRFSNLEEIKEILNYSYKLRRKIALVDIAHGSLSLLMRRILARDPFGKDPCPLLVDIVKGYKESIEIRKKVIEIVEENNSIEFFELYYTDEEEKSQLIAQKKNSKFEIINTNLFEKSLFLPPDIEIERQISEVIDKGRYPNLEKWDREKIGRALNKNAYSNLIKCQRDIDERVWGTIHMEPFDGSWLSEYPYLIEHLDSEHILHIRQSDSDGIGLHWQKDKFPEGPDPNYSQDVRIGNSPKKGFQMKLGYFLIKSKCINSFLSDPSSEVNDQIYDKTTDFFRFFIHPTAYDNFVALHFCQNAKFVKPEHSEYMGTPTSSYRSWVVRNISGKKKAMPFIVKMGVGTAHSRGKFIPKEEVQKSIELQHKICQIAKYNFFFFSETIGITLKKRFYEEDSGIIIREIPFGLLNGEYRIFSFSALMSVERTNEENHGICAILPKSEGLSHFPLIYEIIENTKKKEGISTFGFINKYLISEYLKSINNFYFEQGYSFSPHGQNLCFVLSYNGSPMGFAYRDFEGISENGKGFIDSFSWFYRYHCIVKLLNVITFNSREFYHPPLGAPFQLGCSEPLKERNLYPYVKGFSQNNIYLACSDYEIILKNLDNKFIEHLSQFFSIESMEELKVGAIPAAEPSSVGETQLFLLNKRLWEKRLPQETKSLKITKVFSENRAECELMFINNKLEIALYRLSFPKTSMEGHVNNLFDEASREDRGSLLLDIGRKISEMQSFIS